MWWRNNRLLPNLLPAVRAPAPIPALGLLPVDLDHVGVIAGFTQQVFAEVLGPRPVEPLATDWVAGAGDDDHVETLVGLDERVHQAQGIRRMDVVVDVAVHEQQLALEVLGDLGILVDGVLAVSYTHLTLPTIYSV